MSLSVKATWHKNFVGCVCSKGVCPNCLADRVSLAGLSGGVGG